MHAAAMHEDQRPEFAAAGMRSRSVCSLRGRSATPLLLDMFPEMMHGREAADSRQGAHGLTTGHIPAMRDEAINALLGSVLGADGIYADGTFGRGGHSSEILRRLSPKGRLIAFDVDPSAIQVGRVLMEKDPRFRIVHRPFADVDAVLPDGVELSGMLLDVGFSSPQVDEGGRGWSCLQQGPLDLRMNASAGAPASEWLQTVDTNELAWVLHELGEDDDPVLCQRVAEHVRMRHKSLGSYSSTLDFAKEVKDIKKDIDDRGTHPAKLVFQGVRMWVNQEIEQLLGALEAQFRRLRFGGRAVIVTFKAKEELVVERFLRMYEDGAAAPWVKKARLRPSHLAAIYPLLRTDTTFAARRAIRYERASYAEVERNRRARSAAVHVLEKVPRVPFDVGDVDDEAPLQFVRPVPPSLVVSDCAGSLLPPPLRQNPAWSGDAVKGATPPVTTHVPTPSRSQATSVAHGAVACQPPPPRSPPQPVAPYWIEKAGVNWSRVYAVAQGRSYFYHLETRESRWELPPQEPYDEDF